MKRVFLSLMSLAWLVFAGTMPTMASLPNNIRPNFEVDGLDYGSRCTPSHLTWQSNHAYDRDSMEIRPTSYLSQKGNTTITCQVGAHKVRLVLKTNENGGGRCDASLSATLDTYVDGKKVIDRADWGDWDSCMQNADIATDDLTRLIINSQMHLTLCYDVSNKQSRCVLTDLNAAVKP